MKKDKAKVIANLEKLVKDTADGSRSIDKLVYYVMDDGTEIVFIHWLGHGISRVYVTADSEMTMCWEVLKAITS